MPCPANKQEAHEFGKFAEEMAAEEYVKRGYAIKERNWRLGKTEIDIIAQKDIEVVIIEVKARNNTEIEAVNAVDHNKRRRMVKAADVYLRKYQGYFNYRFDIVTCVGNIENYKMNIYENAFLATDFI